MPTLPVSPLHSRAGNARGRATRELLICTAERLFAERGLQAVSMREVSSVAGQRNNAAIDYHFGSRDDLISAIYTFRANAINERCAQVLDALRSSGLPDAAGPLLRAQLVPHVESLADPDNHFVRFLARAFTESTHLTVMTRLSQSSRLGAVVEAQTRLRACLHQLDDQQFASRISIIANWAIQRLAEFVRDCPDADADGREAMLAELVAMLEGALRA